MWKIDEISQDIVLARLEGILPRYIGPGTKNNISFVSERLRIHRNTVENWYHGREVPSLSNYLKLCALLGPAFLCELLAPIGLGAAALESNSTTDFQFSAMLAESAAVIAKCLSDGSIDHRERNEVKPQLRQLVQLLNHFCGDENGKSQ
ncbi:MAG: hypothetical protein SFX19_10045 [Alphaproteobacteria bacterium]|nr:hypothetical protein [Alphaproteobacteria bacterium]